MHIYKKRKYLARLILFARCLADYFPDLILEAKARITAE